MKFSGRLQLEADPLNWLRTDLLVSSGRLELMAGSDSLGSWATSQVKAERMEGDRFELHLGDDKAVFAADDALAFSYEAMPVLNKRGVLSAASGLREKLRKGLNGPERPESFEPAGQVSPAAAAGAPASNNSGTLGPTARKLRELLEAAQGGRLPSAPAPVAANGEGAVPERAIAVFGDGGGLEAQEDSGGEEPWTSEPWTSEPWTSGPGFLSDPIEDRPPAPAPLSDAPVAPGAGPFDWAREEAETSDQRPGVTAALAHLIRQVEEGSMTSAQVDSITALFRAVADLVDGRSGD